MSEHLELFKLLAAILFGGAGGALITILVTSYKNRIQPVGVRKDISVVFVPPTAIESSITQVTLSGSDHFYHFSNLFLVNITIINRGNKDFESFTFGITSSEDVKIVNNDLYTIDRHHNMVVTPEVYYNKPSQLIDFELKPFNRRDSYQIQLYVTASRNKISKSDFELSSEKPIKFVELPSISEQAATLADIMSDTPMFAVPFKLLAYALRTR